MSNALQAHDDIDVIYCIGKQRYTLGGAVQAVEDAGKTDDDILGKRWSAYWKHAVKDGTIV